MSFALDIEAVLALQRLVASVPWGPDLAGFCARWAILLNIPLAAYLFFRGRKAGKHAIAEAGWTTAAALAMVSFLSYAIRRPRPFLARPDLVANLIPPPYNTSFPSGHTAAAVSIAAALSVADRRMGAVSFALAGITALGRMAVGVHYPTDILGGMAVGLAAFAVVRYAHAGLRGRDIARSALHHRHDA